MSFTEHPPPPFLRGRALRAAAGEAFRALGSAGVLKRPLHGMLALVVLCALGAAVWDTWRGKGAAASGLALAVATACMLSLWLGCFVEALAAGRGRERLAVMGQGCLTVDARRVHGSLAEVSAALDARREVEPWLQRVDATELSPGEVVLVLEEDVLPTDGRVVAGAAMVDESAITGESAPVLREAAPERDEGLAGTRVQSGWLLLEVTVEQGESLVERSGALLHEGSRDVPRQERVLRWLLSVQVLLAMGAVASLAILPQDAAVLGAPSRAPSWGTLLALWVCLLPLAPLVLGAAVTLGAVARLLGANVVPASCAAVEAAGEVDVLLLDKSETCALGNREAVEFIAAPGVEPEQLAEAAQLASLGDESSEGRSIVALAKVAYGLRPGHPDELAGHVSHGIGSDHLSGVDLGDRKLRKGGLEEVESFVEQQGGELPFDVRVVAEQLESRGQTPLVVADGSRGLGVVVLEDSVSLGLAAHCTALRRSGLRTVLISEETPEVTAALAAEAGVDDFLAEATPASMCELVQRYERAGLKVAMSGDGRVDGAALSAANLAVVMNRGSEAHRGAGTMLDLDSSPAKLLGLVELGRGLAITRATLLHFGLGSCLLMSVTVLPVVFGAMSPTLAPLNWLKLHSSSSALLAGLLVQLLAIVAWGPWVLRGLPLALGGEPRRVGRHRAAVMAGLLFGVLPALVLLDWGLSHCGVR